jgi:hypothetical protein
MDLNEYLDSLGLEPADRQTLATTLAKAGDKATAPLLMRADYTKKTQELAKERERIATENAQMNRQYSDALAQLEQGKVTLAQYQAKIERLGTEWGLPEDQWKTPVNGNPEPEKKTAPAGLDPAILARLDQAERNYGISPEISAILQDVEGDYVDTFGARKGFSATELLKYSRENKIPLRADPVNGGRGAFEELYKIADKRREKDIETITAKIRAEEEAKVQQRIDQITAGNATGERNPNNWSQNGSHVLSKEFRDSQAERIKSQGGDPKVLDRAPSQSRSAAQGELEGGAAAFARKFVERRGKGIAYGTEERSA